MTASILLNEADVVLNQGTKVRAFVPGQLSDPFHRPPLRGHEGAEHAADLTEAPLQGPGKDEGTTAYIHADLSAPGSEGWTEAHF